jgi:hypothetical protein
VTRAETALARAASEWALDVREPPHSNWQRIDAYLRGAEGLGWTWLSTYTRNRQAEWCGAFAAFCYSSLSLQIRRDHLASTYRLKRWAKGTPRWVEPANLRPGDIVVVGAEQGRPWGDHVTLCIGVHGDHVDTIEGNAIGLGPDGSRREGVVRTSRPRWVADPKTKRILFGVRPLEEDYSGT